MKKNMKIQNILFIVHLVMLIVSALFALSFMSDYYNLFGFTFAVNEGVAKFHDNLQLFNRIIFWFSVVGLVSIIAMYGLEVRKKVCDRLALIIMSVFLAVSLVLCAYALIKMPALINQYKQVNFTYMWYENPLYTEESVYVMHFRTFIIGFIIYGAIAIETLAFAFTLFFNHKKFVKEIE